MDVLDNQDAPVLASVVIPELNGLLPAWLDYSSVTRFAVVPGSSNMFCSYSQALPNVEELILLGFNSELHCIAGLSGDAWPIVVQSISLKSSRLVSAYLRASTGMRAEDVKQVMHCGWKSAFLEMSSLQMYI